MSVLLIHLSKKKWLWRIIVLAWFDSILQYPLIFRCHANICPIVGLCSDMSQKTKKSVDSWASKCALFQMHNLDDCWNHPPKKCFHIPVLLKNPQMSFSPLVKFAYTTQHEDGKIVRYSPKLNLPNRPHSRIMKNYCYVYCWNSYSAKLKWCHSLVDAKSRDQHPSQLCQSHNHDHKTIGSTRANMLPQENIRWPRACGCDWDVLGAMTLSATKEFPIVWVQDLQCKIVPMWKKLRFWTMKKFWLSAKWTSTRFCTIITTLHKTRLYIALRQVTVTSSSKIIPWSLLWLWHCSR